MRLLAAALTAMAGDSPPPADLDGDGTAETIVWDWEVSVDDHPIPGDWSWSFVTRVAVLDVQAADRYRELLVCQSGTPETTGCQVFRYDHGAFAPLVREMFAYDDVTAAGDGLVIARRKEDHYTRIELYALDGERLVKRPQPMHYAGVAIVLEASFPVRSEPGGTVVANAAAASVLTLVAHDDATVGADWQKQLWLVRTTSGLMGWASGSDLYAASLQYRGEAPGVSPSAWTFAPTPLAAAVPATDLDGDGVLDVFVPRDKGGKVRIGAAALPGRWEEADLFGVVELGPELGRALIGCHRGAARDCHLFRLAAGAVAEIPVTGGFAPDELTASPGIVLTRTNTGTYVRTDKYVVQGAGLARVAQPWVAADRQVVSDHEVILAAAPGEAPVITTVPAGQPLLYVAESGVTPGAWLVRTADGLLGIATDPVEVTEDSGR